MHCQLYIPIAGSQSGLFTSETALSKVPEVLPTSRTLSRCGCLKMQRNRQIVEQNLQNLKTRLAISGARHANAFKRLRWSEGQRITASKDFGCSVIASQPSSVIMKLSPTCARNVSTDTEPSTAKTIPGCNTVVSPVTSCGFSKKL